MNPLKKDTVAAHDKRRPFTQEQLTRIFHSTFYRQCAPDAAEPYDGKDREWRFWLPLIMLFGGARPNEIVQLRASDFKRSAQGNWYFDLDVANDGSSSIQVKTSSSRRRIPLHSELISVGFISFVDARRAADGEDAGLFPTLKPNRYGNKAWYPVKRFNERFLPAEIKLDARQSLYSLRHNVRDALRRVAAPPEVLQAIAGWASGGKQVSDQYGDPGNPDFYVKWVNGIAYEGLDLSYLHV